MSVFWHFCFYMFASISISVGSTRILEAFDNFGTFIGSYISDIQEVIPHILLLGFKISLAPFPNNETSTLGMSFNFICYML